MLGRTLLLTWFAAMPCVAQQHPINWSLSSNSETVQQGKPFLVHLHATIPRGWHLYSLTQAPGGPVPTTIGVTDGSDFVAAGAPTGPPPHAAPDNNFSIVTETYTDSTTFVVPVMARLAGNRLLKIKVNYETCTDRSCLPPRDEILELRLAVSPGSSIPVAALPPINPQSTGSIRGQAATTGQSLPLFLWLAAVMGALSLLTPCVFPMIPITVSYFTRTRGTVGGTPVRHALTYAAGIVATFTVLGMVIAVLAGAGGINRFAANPWINLLVAGIFVAFAFNLFGVFQLALPGSLLTRLDAMTHRAGTGETAGILLMGLTFTLTSFTCTVPFVGSLLVMAAQGSRAWPVLGLLVFSGVFALPFFVLALVPGAVAKLPRSGSWLQSVKVVMGFLELAAAMKFLSNADMVFRWGIVNRPVVLTIWLAIALLTTAYLLGLVRGNEPRPRIGRSRSVFALMALAIAVYVGRGLTGSRLGELESFVPPPEGIVTAGLAAAPGELPWMVNDYDGGLARARLEHKSVLVDFTGYTCTNCRWMEANMFPRERVREQLGRFVLVRLYTDGQGAVYQRQQEMEQEKLGTVALPYYAVIDTFGRVTAQFLGMTRNTDEFVRFLRDGQSSTMP